MATVNPHFAKQLIAKQLAAHGLPPLRLTAKTIDFTDLARASCVFVTVHGWTPGTAADLLITTAKTHGFRVDFK